MGRRSVLEVGTALVLGVALGLGAHAWLGPAGAQPAQVAGATLERVLSADQLRSLGAERVLEVHAAGCAGRRQGSATFVRDAAGRSLLLTNAHVVRGASTVTVDLPDGSSREVAVLGALEDRDAALLDPAPLDGAGPSPAPVGAAVDAGDPVSVVGHPGGSFRVDATLVDDVQRRAAFGGASDVLLMASAAEGGHSGGAVLDPRGAVVGLVAARDPLTSRVVAYRIGDLVGVPLGPLPGC